MVAMTTSIHAQEGIVMGRLNPPNIRIAETIIGIAPTPVSRHMHRMARFGFDTALLQEWIGIDTDSATREGDLNACSSTKKDTP